MTGFRSESILLIDERMTRALAALPSVALHVDGPDFDQWAALSGISTVNIGRVAERAFTLGFADRRTGAVHETVQAFLRGKVKEMIHGKRR